jgi:phosphotransferase system HPr (HPr) family protein
VTLVRDTVLLSEALHARPANLLVRLASQHAAAVRLRTGGRSADARKILEVLALGAQKGELLEIASEGTEAEEAVSAIAELVKRCFDTDLVPDRGSGAVEGIAIGRALVASGLVTAHDEGRVSAPPTRRPDEERARLAKAEARALEELRVLLEGLAPEERALFEPERAILRDVAAAAVERTLAGETSEQAVLATTQDVPTDLVLDARARLMEALGDEEGTSDVLARIGELGDEVVVVTDGLTPSLVARMPRQVVGIVAVEDDAPAGPVRTSHAAILARGRELPLAMVPGYVVEGIAEGEVVVLDTTLEPARVWCRPGEALIADARARRRGRVEAGAELARAIAAVSTRLGTAVLVNVGSLHDRVPEGVAGVGLLRTELLFAGRSSAPGEADQAAAILSVARAARGGEVTARLWDAGGDKPLAWLPSRDPTARGVALLLDHPSVLATQLAAMARAAERARVRVLVPMTRDAAEVDAVRRGLASLGPSGAGVLVGAMIETPGAAEDAASIARAADFVCLGTNDLAALVLGTERTDAAQALDPRVLRLIRGVVGVTRALGKKVTVCGEIAADPLGARIMVGLGVHALSVAPPRLQGTVRALEGVSFEDCRAVVASVEEGSSS